MNVYNFSFYAARREEAKAAAAVTESILQLDKVGEVVKLKQNVKNWFLIHQDNQKILRTGTS